MKKFELTDEFITNAFGNKLYRQGNEILGCDNCIVEVNAWEWKEEQEEQ